MLLRLEKVSNQMKSLGVVSILRRNAFKPSVFRKITHVPSVMSVAPQIQNYNAKKRVQQINSRFLLTFNSPSKVVNCAKEALSDCIFPGARINCGGFGLGGIPETLLNELANDERATDLTIASLTAGVDGFGLGLLFESGKVKRMIASYVGENHVRPAT